MTSSASTAASQEEPRLDWHAAFYSALQAELVDYLDVLQFEQEHYLNEQPLRIDALIIKKQPGVAIKKNIAMHFREHNIFEYKSPDDSLGVSEYLKTIGYAYLYQAIKSVDYSGITVNIVCTMRPDALLKYLHNSHQGRYAATEKSSGIYVICGERFPVQIVESKKLLPKENAWLASLKKDAEKTALQAAIKSNPNVHKTINLSAYWYVVSRANAAYLKEVIGMSLEQIEAEWEAFLDEIGFTAKWEAKFMAEFKAVIKGLQKNVSLHQLANETGIPLERVEKIKQIING